MSDRPTPRTSEAYKQRDGEGALDHAIRMALTMESLEREADELREALDKESSMLLEAHKICCMASTEEGIGIEIQKWSYRHRNHLCEIARAALNTEPKK